MTDVDIEPEEAFAMLGNETRIDIVRVLGEARGEPLSFSELHGAVGIRDSGQFNYHLNQLIGTFVRRTDDGTYKLSYAGSRVVGAIFSGEFNRSATLGTFALDSDCAHCATQLKATYEDERVKIRCPGCDELDTGFGFPPGGVQNRTPEELTTVFDRWLRSMFALIIDNICYNCAGSLMASITDESEFLHPDDQVCIEYVCDRCADSSTLSVSSYLYLRPEVVRFYYEQGVDLHEIEMWNARSFIESDISIASRDPWRIETTLDHEDRRLSLLIEEDLSISQQ